MLIFDLDGTLVDSRRDIAAACNHALEAVGRPRLPDELVATFVGDGARKLLERALGPADAPTAARAMDAFLDFYLAHPVVHTRPMPGAVEALDALAGRPMAVATNKRREVAVAVLRDLGLARRFGAVWGGGDGPVKPDPACVLALAERAGVPPSDVWMVGDGTQDVGAGKAAGAHTVAVLGGFHDEARLRALAPEHVVRDLRELPALLEP